MCMCIACHGCPFCLCARGWRRGLRMLDKRAWQHQAGQEAGQAAEQEALAVPSIQEERKCTSQGISLMLRPISKTGSSNLERLWMTYFHDRNQRWYCHDGANEESVLEYKPASAHFPEEGAMHQRYSPVSHSLLAAPPLVGPDRPGIFRVPRGRIWRPVGQVHRCCHHGGARCSVAGCKLQPERRVDSADEFV